jgi:L-lactate dehydrogenase complex protein LldG
VSNAREAILQRLRAAPGKPVPELPPWTPCLAATESKVGRFRRMMEAVKGEVHETTRAGWPALLRRLLGEKKARRLLYAPGTEIGRAIEREWGVESGAALVSYDRPIEDMKPVLVNEVDAGITGTMGGIADTGSLIVWPSATEPRLMSLLPPIHVAVLDASRIFDSLTQAMEALGWNKSPPGNSLLISGPSKTADIEGILCFGVHGPKQLIVLLITD